MLGLLNQKRITKNMTKAKISKIMIWPSRTINLGNFNSAKLDAGIEMVFPKPIALDSKQLTDTMKEAREIIRKEFVAQYEPYRKLLIKNKGEQNG